MRQQLPPSCGDIRLNRLRAVLDTILHHAIQVFTAMDFLAFDGRSEQLHREISGFTSLGAAAALLEDVDRELEERD